MELRYTLIVDESENLVTTSLEEALAAFRIAAEQVKEMEGDIEASLDVGWVI